jgi:hypothetical protein
MPLSHAHSPPVIFLFQIPEFDEKIATVMRLSGLQKGIDHPPCLCRDSGAHGDTKTRPIVPRSLRLSVEAISATQMARLYHCRGKTKPFGLKT